MPLNRETVLICAIEDAMRNGFVEYGELVLVYGEMIWFKHRQLNAIELLFDSPFPKYYFGLSWGYELKKFVTKKDKLEFLRTYVQEEKR